MTDAGISPEVVEDLFISDPHGEFGSFSQIVADLRGPRTRVHMLGDVYDRGPAPDRIMDQLAQLDACSIVWGNHDILWMGASLGQRGSVANVVRICARYGNLAVLEETYGMNLQPLREFAARAYASDPCVAFGCKGNPHLNEDELQTTMKIQKAMAFIQFKVEAKLIDENPSFCLQARKLLHCIDYAAGTVEIEGETYPLTDTVFPTINPTDPYCLTPDEETVMQHLVDEFVGNQRLQQHMATFLEKGSLYAILDNTLLFHACVPLNSDGSLKEVELFGQTYSGKALFDAVDVFVRNAFRQSDPVSKKQGLDMLWYLWLGEGSPLFAKSKMATFELYLIEDKAARTEVKNAFYSYLEDEAAMASILESFGLSGEDGRMVCGHTPIKVKDGQSPIKCGGKVLIIDGGMSRAYQPTTGIAGFVLVKTLEGMQLATLVNAADGTLSYTWRYV